MQKDVVLAWASAGNRACLRQSIVELVSNAAAYGHRPALVLATDAPDEGRVLELESTLLHVSGAYGVTVGMSGPSDRERAIRRLSRDFDPVVLSFVFNTHEHPRETLGPSANRNALTLAHAGLRYIQSDDDVLARPARTTNTGTARSGGSAKDVGATRGLKRSSDYMPADLLYFPDRQTLLESVTSVERDVLGEHEKLLGAELTYATTRQPDSNADSSGGEVRITSAGAYGDSGMSSPRTVLSLDSNARRHAYERGPGYEAVRLSREVVRIPESTTVTRGTHLMAMHVGLDNMRLLPPWFPIGRNSDGFFSVLLRLTDPGSLTGLLDFGLYHDPPEPRRFPPESLTELNPRSVDLVMALVVHNRPPGHIKDPADRMRDIGAALQEAASLPTRDFIHLVHENWSRGFHTYAERLESLLERYDHNPAAWATDVEAHLEVVFERLREPASILPERHGPRSSEVTKRRTLMFGRLLSMWPDLWEFFRARNDAGDKPVLFRWL